MKMAGVQGFEPWNGGVKVRCLTTWRYPNIGDWLLVFLSCIEPSNSQTRALERQRIIVKNGESQKIFSIYKTDYIFDKY